VSRWRTILLAAAVMAAGCQSDSGGTSAAKVDPPARGDTSSPFTIGHTPPGYYVTGAGEGHNQQEWGDDDVGTTEPFTALRRGDDTLIASVTGYQGYQGGFEQASRAYICGGGTVRRQNRLTVNGRRAVFTPSQDDDGRCDNPSSELLVDRGNNLAVRVNSSSASRNELMDFERNVDPSDDHSRPPSVEPPEGWDVVGFVDADIKAALGVGYHLDSPATTVSWVPGPEGSHVVTMANGSALLSVLTLPGADPTGLLGLDGYQTSATDGDVLIEGGDSTRAIARKTAWGDLLIVTSLVTPLSRAELVAVADSVRAADTPTWDRYLIDLTGGPGLHTEPGAIDIIRTETWLLEGRPSVVRPGAFDASTCLKTLAHRLACAHDGSTEPAPGIWVSYFAGDTYFPGFIEVIAEQADGGHIRAQSDSDDVVVDLHRLPGTPTRWVSIALMKQPGPPGNCANRQPGQIALYLESPSGSRCLGT
jgi:hypothetical protein